MLAKETIKDQALKETLLEKAEKLDETKIALGRQQEGIQVMYARGVDAKAPTPALGTLVACSPHFHV